ncbi:MAG: hypothetical protein NTU59_03810 [Coprothermobacterota bacterium]|nr:hypothetical protein [Coprothermobacterota bacterium]
MREFRFLLGKRALIVFLAFLVAAGALFGMPTNTRILAENPPPASREVSAALTDLAATEGLPAAAEEWPILDSSGPPPFLQAGSGDTWTETNTAKDPTTTPTKRYNHAMAAIPSGVLLFGGKDKSGGRLNDTWLFNTSTNTWGQITGSPSTPTARQYHAMATTALGVLLFGGYYYASGDHYLNDTWLYNTATNRWSQVSASLTPTARYQHAMATTASGVLLFGGYYYASGDHYLNDTWLYNTATNSWSQVFTSSTPTARWGHVMAATPAGVLLFGGYYYANGDHYLGETWLFNTSTNTWVQITGSPSTPTARRYHAMAATVSGVLLFGGYGSSGSLDDTWLFTPALVPTITVSSPTAGATRVVGENTSITWTSTDLTNTLSIQLARNGVDFTETITTGLTNTATHYPWTVTGTAGTICLIRVTDGTVTGTSGTFSIAAHSETVDHLSLSPAGATLLAGTSTDYTLIAYDTETNTWDVTSSATYVIDPGAEGTWTSTNRYTSSNAGTWTVTASYDGKSATAQLTITATLHLSAPVGGEDWIRSHAYPITWTSTGVTGTTTIELSRDNGSTWETLTVITATGGTFFWTVTAPRTTQAVVRVSGSGQSDQSPAVFRLRDPQIDLLSPIGGEVWTIDSQHAVTWTSTDLNTNTLTILLARNGVNFTETITTGLTNTATQHTWTVSGPGTINAKIRVQQANCQDSSPVFFALTATLFPYIGGTTALITADPWLKISGGSGSGTLWVTPLTTANTSDPNLNQFMQETGQRSALFFDIGQQGLNGTLTIVLHYAPQLGEENFSLYRWDQTNTKWIPVSGTLNPASHTFTFQVLASDLTGTPFALGGDPLAMPGISPWALALLALSLLGLGGWWFLRRRRLA